MKTLRKEVYYCDHCKRHGLSAGLMTVHENRCLSNPKNIRACIGCIFLEEIEIPYTVISQIAFDEFQYTDKVTTGFKCLHPSINHKMYHVKAEFKKLPEKYPETFADQHPMPLECEHLYTDIELINQFYNYW